MLGWLLSWQRDAHIFEMFPPFIYLFFWRRDWKEGRKWEKGEGWGQWEANRGNVGYRDTCEQRI